MAVTGRYLLVKVKIRCSVIFNIKSIYCYFTILNTTIAIVCFHVKLVNCEKNQLVCIIIMETV